MKANTAILMMEGWPALGSGPRLRDTRSLLPLIDKPLLQYGVEALVRLGCQQAHVLLGSEPQAVRKLLDNGERWGIQIHYHYLQEDADLGQNLRSLALQPEQAYWLAYPDRLPCDLSALKHAQTVLNTALCWRETHGLKWTGWGCFSGSWLTSQQQAPEFDAIESLILADQNLTHQVASTAPLSVVNDADYLSSSKRELQHRMTESGQSLIQSRGAVLHKSAQFTGLVHIGQHARVEAGARLGPNVIVCEGAVVGTRAELSDCVVLPDTYVGPELELNQVIVAPGKLSSISNQVVLDSIEPGFLDAIKDRPMTNLASTPSLSITLVLLKLFLSPLWLSLIHI